MTQEQPTTQPSPDELQLDPALLQPPRYIDLTIEQLEELKTKPFDASGYSLEGLEEHPGFSKIFTHRANPSAIIQILLKELYKQQKANGIPKAKKPKEPKKPEGPDRVELAKLNTKNTLEVKKFEAEQTEKYLTLKNSNLEKRLEAAEQDRELKHEMLAVRKLEAEAKISRGESLTVFQNRILSKLQTIEKKLDYLLTQMATTNQE